MKKLLPIVFLMFSLMLAGHAAAAAGRYMYSLDIDILEAGINAPIDNQIGIIEFQALGGTYPGDWELTLGNAVPGDGNWILESYGSYTGIRDDYDPFDPSYTPLLSGNILTISSSVELNFDNLAFFDFRGQVVDSGFFETAGFQETAVPIPGSVILLGSGLLGALGFTRRKK